MNYLLVGIDHLFVHIQPIVTVVLKPNLAVSSPLFFASLMHSYKTVARSIYAKQVTRLKLQTRIYLLTSII